MSVFVLKLDPTSMGLAAPYVKDGGFCHHMDVLSYSIMVPNGCGMMKESDIVGTCAVGGGKVIPS